MSIKQLIVKWIVAILSIVIMVTSSLELYKKEKVCYILLNKKQYQSLQGSKHSLKSYPTYYFRLERQGYYVEREVEFNDWVKYSEGSQVCFLENPDKNPILMLYLALGVCSGIYGIFVVFVLLVKLIDKGFNYVWNALK